MKKHDNKLWFLLSMAAVALAAHGIGRLNKPKALPAPSIDPKSYVEQRKAAMERNRENLEDTEC